MRCLTFNSHAYPEEGEEEAVREGFEPDHPQPENPEGAHNLDYPFTTGEGKKSDDISPPVNEEAEQWEERDYSDNRAQNKSPQYGSFRDEHDAWNGRS